MIKIMLPNIANFDQIEWFDFEGQGLYKSRSSLDCSWRYCPKVVVTKFEENPLKNINAKVFGQQRQPRNCSSKFPLFKKSWANYKMMCIAPTCSGSQCFTDSFSRIIWNLSSEIPSQETYNYKNMMKRRNSKFRVNWIIFKWKSQDTMVILVQLTLSLPLRRVNPSASNI